jgi:hypothetical protein
MKTILLATMIPWLRTRCITKFFAPLLLLIMSGACATAPCPYANDFSACFYDFTDVYNDRIYSVITLAPGASDVKRIWPGCEESRKCLCYELYYEGSADDLSSWLRQELPLSEVIPFRIEHKGYNRLEISFQGGFD